MPLLLSVHGPYLQEGWILDTTTRSSMVTNSSTCTSTKQSLMQTNLSHGGHDLHNVLTILPQTWQRPSTSRKEGSGTNRISDRIDTRRKPQVEWRYNMLICTNYVFMDACSKIDTISNLWACSFGQQLTKYPS
jgi:hypothetical protein